MSIGNGYVETGKKDKLVLDYTETYNFQEFFNWSLDIPYGSLSKEEVMERKKRTELCLLAGDQEKFLDFKRKYLDTYEKIAYLLPIEMNRTVEKEQAKQKGKKMLV